MTAQFAQVAQPMTHRWIGSLGNLCRNKININIYSHSKVISERYL